MKAYDQFVEWARLLALFSAVFIGDIFLRRLESYHLSRTLIALFIGLLAIVSLHIAELVVVRLFEKSVWLKCRILGMQWVEGVWFDEVIGENQFALINMRMDHGEMKISGEQYDLQGRVTATWESIGAWFEGETLRTIYRSPQFLGSVTELSGYSTYVFTGGTGEEPRFYSGFFVDAGHGRQCQLRGVRICDPDTLRGLADPHFRHSHFANLVRKYSAPYDR